ncbi:galactokinase [Homoserinibacter sp. GY 40078]|uniref:galactokinase n=1 Tax=Homoserinibacter sp. GY 40078 TaxID=2603275 RepID=UPI0011CC244A|nr:galactokinase [Homoserinibacter sp. GY 40078]TXK19281.1 galactokinase [Homoserinibacter sp. GY 40078]
MTQDLRELVRAEFIEVFGTTPVGVWSAPGRVNLIGEHTDYNEGFVLPFAIDRRTFAAVGVRDDSRIRVASTFSDEVAEISITELSADAVSGWAAYPLGVAWALGELGFADLGAVPGVDIMIESDVPVGAGLSSSAAIESAVAVALAELWQLDIDRPALARVGRLAENEAVGAPTGIMDQMASLLGRDDAAVFIDCRSQEADAVDLGLAGAGLAILVIDTQVEHAHATGGYRDRRASCEAGAAALGVASLRDVEVADLVRAKELLDDVTFRRVRHVVTENQRVLDTVATLTAAGPLEIGELLDASHRSMRDDFEISVPELDLAVETAQANGALGARMTGGGFGGSAIALVPQGLVSQVQVAVDGAFAEHGFGQPVTFTVTPSAGARREV